jgi:hypothetical protein
VGREHRWIEGLSGEVAAELGFPNSAITKYENFFAIDWYCFYF